MYAGVVRHRPPHRGPVEEGDGGVGEGHGVTAGDGLALGGGAGPQAVGVAQAGGVAWRNVVEGLANTRSA